MTATAERSEVSEWNQLMAVTRLEMTSYLRSPVTFVFALLMPTALLMVAYWAWYPEAGRPMIVPDMAVLSVLSRGLFSIGVAITEQRKEGTLKTYLSSPLRARTYIGAQVLDRVIVTAVGNVVMVAVAWLAFDLTPGGSLWIYALATMLSLATMLAFGFLLAARFKSVETAGATSGIIFFAVMLGSGFFVNADQFPTWLARGLDFLPFKPVVEMMRETWTEPGFSAWGPAVVVAG